MNIYLQYGFIAVMFVVAVWYVYNLAKETFSKKKDDDGCGGNCGCK